MNLLRNVDIVRATSNRKESTTITSKYIDTQGFDGVLFIAVGSTKFNSTGAFSMQLTGTTAESTASQSDYGSVNGSTANLASTGTIDRKIFCVDCYRPEKRYVRLHIYGAGSTDFIDNIVAVRYAPRKAGSTTLGQSTHLYYAGVDIGTT